MALIGICGNIGTGKTSLCENLVNLYRFTLVEENILGNPFLPKFYDDMPTWALRSQLKFLIDRHLAAIALSEHERAVEDRLIYEDIYVFAATLFEEGAISRDDWELYRKIAEYIVSLHPSYDLVIYLHADVRTLYRRIIARGRPFEKELPVEYLTRLQGKYEGVLERIRTRSSTISVDTDQVDTRTPAAAHDLA